MVAKPSPVKVQRADWEGWSQVDLHPHVILKGRVKMQRESQRSRTMSARLFFQFSSSTNISLCKYSCALSHSLPVSHLTIAAASPFLLICWDGCYHYSSGCHKPFFILRFFPLGPPATMEVRGGRRVTCHSSHILWYRNEQKTACFA